MNTLRENINYSDSIICSNCHSQIQYHVTDIKGVNEKFIICPVCHQKLQVPDTNVSYSEK